MSSWRGPRIHFKDYKPNLQKNNQSLPIAPIEIKKQSNIPVNIKSSDVTPSLESAKIKENVIFNKPINEDGNGKSPSSEKNEIEMPVLIEPVVIEQPITLEQQESL